MKHECPGLRVCLNHPRWHVLAFQSFAAVFDPGPDLTSKTFYTLEEALNYAQQQATNASWIYATQCPPSPPQPRNYSFAVHYPAKPREPQDITDAKNARDNLENHVRELETELEAAKQALRAVTKKAAQNLEHAPTECECPCNCP